MKIFMYIHCVYTFEVLILEKINFTVSGRMLRHLLKIFGTSPILNSLQILTFVIFRFLGQIVQPVDWGIEYRGVKFTSEISFEIL